MTTPRYMKPCTVSTRRDPSSDLSLKLYGMSLKLPSNLSTRSWSATREKKAGNVKVFKLFSRASEDGFMHNMILYQGALTLQAHKGLLNPEQQTLSKTSQIVTVLASTMTANTTTTIFADNYFTSLEVICYLQSINCRYTSTSTDCLVDNPLLKNIEDMSKKSEPRGSYSYTTSDDGHHGSS